MLSGEKRLFRHAEGRPIRAAFLSATAVGNMEALNVLSVGSFGSDRLETAVTRADAARMLSAAGTLLRGEKDTGLLGLLKKS